MWRRLKQLVVGASLALCVTVGVVWLRSYWRSDAVAYSNQNGHRAVQWAKGVVLFGRDNVGAANGGFELDSWNAEGMDVRLGTGVWTQLGFGHDRTVTATTSLPATVQASFANPPPATIVSDRFSVPLWLLFVLFLALPGRTAIAVLRRWQRRRSKRCVACGYDLRASGDRCPECGTAIGNAEPAAT
jgi:hypothetical protein